MEDECNVWDRLKKDDLSFSENCIVRSNSAMKPQKEMELTGNPMKIRGKRSEKRENQRGNR